MFPPLTLVNHVIGPSTRLLMSAHIAVVGNTTPRSFLVGFTTASTLGRRQRRGRTAAATPRRFLSRGAKTGHE